MVHAKLLVSKEDLVKSGTEPFVWVRASMQHHIQLLGEFDNAKQTRGAVMSRRDDLAKRDLVPQLPTI